MKLSIILAPYDSGYLHGGFGLGPEAIISGGLVEALSLNGHDVTVAEIGEVGNEQRREIATGFAVCKAVATKVDASLAAGRFPVVLAGNCLATAGAVAGEAADSIIWADQHGDFNTPDTSIHGFLDGMALATICGLCWRSMAAAIPGFKAIDPSRCLLIDARDLDPGEKQLLASLPVLRAQCNEALGEAAKAHCSRRKANPSAPGPGCPRPGYAAGQPLRHAGRSKSGRSQADDVRRRAVDADCRCHDFRLRPRLRSQGRCPSAGRRTSHELLAAMERI